MATITERLLREILSLRPEQQIKLVKKLAKGKCDKGRSFGKSEFKEEAEKYRLGNTLEKKAFEMLEEDDRRQVGRIQRRLLKKSA